jgi:exopolysaccharide biosynthesis polyprenyl glycosylphosphotransferase
MMQANGTSIFDMRLQVSDRRWFPGVLRPVSGVFCQVFDLAALGVAAGSAYLLLSPNRQDLSLHDVLRLRVSLGGLFLAALCVSLWRISLWGLGAYAERSIGSLTEYLIRCVAGLSLCASELGLLEILRGSRNDVGHEIGIFWAAAFLLMAAARTGTVLYVRHVLPTFRTDRNLIILGSGARALRVYRELQANSQWDYNLLGFVDSEPQGGFVPEEMILGGTEDLEDLLMHTIVDDVVIALPMKSQYEVVGRAVAICERLGIQSQYFSDHFGSTLTKRRFTAGPQSGRIVMQVVHHDYRRYVKRVLDFTLSLLGLIVLSPLLLATAIAVKLTSPGPVLFRQERFGLAKRRFWMLKFRSMCVDAEARQAHLEHLNETSGPAFKIKKDPRVTPIGAFLRKMSIDELPQLVNVLVGDMSLVGPRPLPMRDVSRFSEAWLMRRFSVKPGLTCLWQVMGRSNTDFERWIELDLKYIDNWSLTMDFMILIKTIPAVLKGSGAA